MLPAENLNNKLKELSPVKNIPDVIINKWKDELSTDQLKKIANQHLLTPPALDISISPREDIKKWKANLKGEIFGNNNIRLINNYGKIDNLYGYNDGKWWIQDIAAQIPVKILLSKIKKNANVIDICAAPGGKTAQMLNEGAQVKAIDISNLRVKKLSNNIKRTFY